MGDVQQNGSCVSLQIEGAGSQPVAVGLLAGSIAGDRHYTVAELAKIWHLSPNTIRRQVENEPGVVRIAAAHPYRNSRKRHMTQIRVPERVALRVHARLSN
jgi:hypothetical protein